MIPFKNGTAKNGVKIDEWIADALNVRTINAYLHTNYTVEDLQHWPEHRIEEMLATIDILTKK